jgi:hypothetical protein
MTIKPQLEKILKGILHTEDERNKTMREQEILNFWRRKGK